MRRNVELYIQNQKADLFDFEDINITNSIKDIKDIQKKQRPRVLHTLL